MEYASVQVKSTPELSEILISFLFEIGFDSFQENEDGSFHASIPKDLFDDKKLKEVFKNFDEVSYVVQEESKINWNKEWEKNYDPIIIEDKCLVRATFHEPDPSKEYEIIITPKMSFGTGHHDTTYQILDYQMQTDFKNKKVLDVGCGTAILSIMAFKRGAKEVMATDIDDWCIENSRENFELNQFKSNYQLFKGQVDGVNKNGFDIILANINKNVLLAQIKDYAERLVSGGLLILSGFYEGDIPDLLDKSKQYSMVEVKRTHRNRWAMLALKKLTT